MWAVLLPILLPIAESALAGLAGYALVHWGPNLGISEGQAVAIAAALAKLAPTNTTKVVAPATVAKIEDVPVAAVK